MRRRDALPVSYPGTISASNGLVPEEVTIVSETFGILVYDPEHLDRINLEDEAITIAVMPPYTVVEAGQVVATVKIIPYSVDENTVTRIEKMQPSRPALLHVAVFNSLKIGFIQTFYPGMNLAILNKTRKTLDSRLQRLGSAVTSEAAL